MTERRIRVGIIGLEPQRSWAARAHLPALAALSQDFEVIGVANTSWESAERAAAATGLPKAFASVSELVHSPDIDLVTVTVRVPHHLKVVTEALEAGKHVYCEWPLGRNLAEAEELHHLAQSKGVRAFVGLQACSSPVIEYLKDLIATGYVGEVLSTTVVACGAGWGGTIAQERNDSYLLDPANGATMLSIPVGHTLAAMQTVLGDVTKLSSVLATRRTAATALDTGKSLSNSSPDQVLLSGLMSGGAPMSMHYRGGMARDGRGLLWEISGTEGDIRVAGPFGHVQLVPLVLTGARGDEKEFETLEVPAELLAGWPENPAVGNVARLYARTARDLRDGTDTAPSFGDAVRLHRVLNAIGEASRGVAASPSIASRER